MTDRAKQSNSWPLAVILSVAMICVTALVIAMIMALPHVR